MADSAAGRVMDPVVIRASSLSGYADCPRRAATKMFRAEIEACGYELGTTANSIGAKVGTAVHAGVANLLKDKARTGFVPADDSCLDAALDSLREPVDGAMLWDAETPEIATAERQAVRMVGAYRAQRAPTIDPILVEERLEADYDGLVVSGQSDVTARAPNTIHDLKTGKREGNHGPQIGAYSLIQRSHGYPIEHGAIDFVQRVSMKKDQPPVVTRTLRLAQCETAAVAILGAIAADLAIFREGDPKRRLLPGDPWAFLANPSSMLCSRKWCPAHSTAFCSEHKED